MVITGPELLNDTLFLAAEARVSGLTWEAAAKKQTMTGSELRKIAYDELPRWKELLRDAERMLTFVHFEQPPGRRRQALGLRVDRVEPQPHRCHRLNDRLYWAFFYGLNTAQEDHAVHSAAELIERRGTVPFLNVGLFDLEDQYDAMDAVQIPNAAFDSILKLFEKYNFTVAESTPLDVEVAVDPEMLGKVFEELVTGRHESGSYYTPRAIVSFMCREALKHYLANESRPEKSDNKPPTNEPPGLSRWLVMVLVFRVARPSPSSSTTATPPA